MIHYLRRFPVNSPQENKVFQRPCRSVLLPSYFLPPPLWITMTVVFLVWQGPWGTLESRKSEKCTKKIHNPPRAGSPPKMPKNKKLKKYKNGNFWAIFVFFRYFVFLYLRGPTSAWGIFFVVSYIRDSGGFGLRATPAGSQFHWRIGFFCLPSQTTLP